MMAVANMAGVKDRTASMAAALTRARIKTAA